MNVKRKKKEEKELIEEGVKKPIVKKEEYVEIITHGVDTARLEVKELDISDLDDVISILRRAQFELTAEVRRQVKDILSMGLSYGGYYNRNLVAVCLSYPVGFDEATRSFLEGNNALYIEEIAILPSYEGKGIRETLISEVEKKIAPLGVCYIISIVDINPEGNIEEFIKNRGSISAKTYLKLGYGFFRHELGLVAYKKLC